MPPNVTICFVWDQNRPRGQIPFKMIPNMTIFHLFSINVEHPWPLRGFQKYSDCYHELQQTTGFTSTTYFINWAYWINGLPSTIFLLTVHACIPWKEMHSKKKGLWTCIRLYKLLLPLLLSWKYNLIGGYRLKSGCTPNTSEGASSFQRCTPNTSEGASNYHNYRVIISIIIAV